MPISITIDEKTRYKTFRYRLDDAFQYQIFSLGSLVLTFFFFFVALSTQSLVLLAIAGIGMVATLTFYRIHQTKDVVYDEKLYVYTIDFLKNLDDYGTHGLQQFRSRSIKNLKKIVNLTYEWTLPDTAITQESVLRSGKLITEKINNGIIPILKKDQKDLFPHATEAMMKLLGFLEIQSPESLHPLMKALGDIPIQEKPGLGQQLTIGIAKRSWVKLVLSSALIFLVSFGVFFIGTQILGADSLSAFWPSVGFFAVLEAAVILARRR